MLAYIPYMDPMGYGSTKLLADLYWILPVFRTEPSKLSKELTMTEHLNMVVKKSAIMVCVGFSETIGPTVGHWCLILGRTGHFTVDLWPLR